MELRLSAIRTIGIGGREDSIVHHNHGGLIRDKGECPACDEIYSFHMAVAQGTA